MVCTLTAKYDNFLSLFGSPPVSPSIPTNSRRVNITNGEAICVLKVWT